MEYLIARYFLHFLISGRKRVKIIENVKKKLHFFKKENMENLLHRKVVFQHSEQFVCHGFFITSLKKKCCFFLTSILAEKARISEKMYRGSVWSFHKCWYFVFNYVFPLTWSKWVKKNDIWHHVLVTCHVYTLFLNITYYLFLFRLPLFVTKTLKCNISCLWYI